MLDTATIGGATLLSGGSAREVLAQDRQTTMVIAAPATPQSLDCNFDVSLGTFEAIAALYDNLLGFENIAGPRRAGRRGARTSRFTPTNRAP